jgi:broad specificity phosphatase PhoE
VAGVKTGRLVRTICASKGDVLLKVILVRHGETDWNKAHRVQGSNSDIPLNNVGKKQAASLALRLKEEEIQAVYSSPLRRARDTARAIARPHRLEVKVDHDLLELDAGELEGVFVSSIGKRLSELLAEAGHDSLPAEGGMLGMIPYIGGESLAAVQRRAWDVVQKIVKSHADGVIVIVSHYFVIMTVICAVLGLPVSQIRRLRFGVGSISSIVFDGDGQPPYLALFNDTCHLAE